jgi:MSHA biogenesis protein MshG
MPQYAYQARAARGQPVNGRLQAGDLDAAASQLVGRGLTPIKIEIVGAQDSITRKLNDWLGANKIRTNDLIMFCRQMYTISKSGIPLTRGISGLAASIRHEYFREVLNEVTQRLESGSSLSAAMRHYPKVFDSLFVNMVEVGESSGKLDEVFKQIGFYIERDEETRKKIKSAMRYPSFVTIAMLAAVVIINIFVIPQFTSLFAKFDVELPLVTKILIGMSDVFVHYWIVMLVVLAAAIGFWVYFMSSDNGKIFWGRNKMRLPIAGGLISRASMARYARSFSLMLRAGVPITQALNLCAAAIDNVFLEKKIIGIREGVERGEGLLRTHTQADMFTPLVLQMVAVGEESGQVENLLQDVAEFYEREVEYDLSTLTSRIEPILIAFLAGFVLILALGIFMPMWGLYDVQLS